MVFSNVLFKLTRIYKTIYGNYASLKFGNISIKANWECLHTSKTKVLFVQ